MGEIADRLLESDEPYGGHPDAAWRGIDWCDHEQQTLVAGRVLNYVDMGSGDVPVVLVHGHGSTWQYWLEVMALLVGGRRVIAVDLPGFGASQAHSFSAVSMDTVVGALVQLLDKLGVTRYDLIGHSLGTIIGIEIAAFDQHRIRTLTLAGGPARSVLAIFQQPVRTALRYPSLALKVLGDMLTAGLPIPGWLRRMVARRPWLRRLAFGSYVARPRDLSADLAEELMKGVGAPGYFHIPLKARGYRPAPFEAVRCPVLLVNGSEDAFVPYADVRAFLARTPDAVSHIIGGAGHLVTVEYPATFISLFEKFLTAAP
jgi:pimeloyl-ACP methyl ester carboxylesterase